MAKYVAFLRGMNLGRRRLRNEELCRCFEKLGFEGVAAFLASGNVLFDPGDHSVDDLERVIETGLEQQLNYAVPTFVRSAKSVAAIAAHAPFSEAILKRTTGNLQVALLAAKPTATQRKATVACATSADHLSIQGKELYWLPKGNLLDSSLDLKTIGAAVGPITIRTHRTMVRLAARLR